MKGLGFAKRSENIINRKIGCFYIKAIPNFFWGPRKNIFLRERRLKKKLTKHEKVNIFQWKIIWFFIEKCWLFSLLKKFQKISTFCFSIAKKHIFFRIWEKKFSIASTQIFLNFRMVSFSERSRHSFVGFGSVEKN